MAYRLDIKRILSMNFFHDLPQIMLGCALAAIATDLFLIPNGLAAGGVTGLATIIQDHVTANDHRKACIQCVFD